MIARDVIPMTNKLIAARHLSRDVADVLCHHGVLEAQIIRANGRHEKTIFGFNARVNAGAAAQAGDLYGTQTAIFAYFACSPTTLTPAMGDTSLSGEITSGGFVRALAAYAYTAPSSLGGTYVATFTKTFTGSGAWTVNSIALFNQLAIGGTMFSEINLTSTASGASGDSLALTYTVTQ